MVLKACGQVLASLLDWDDIIIHIRYKIPGSPIGEEYNLAVSTRGCVRIQRTYQIGTESLMETSPPC